MAISSKHKAGALRVTRVVWEAEDTHEIDVPHDALSGVTSDQHHTRYTDGEALVAAKADSDIASAISLKHSNSFDHSNSLDHSHANKTLLDTYTQTEVNLADAVSKKHAQAHTHPESEVTNLVTDLGAKEAIANKGQVNGYAGLGADGIVPSSQLPPPSGAGNFGQVSIPFVSWLNEDKVSVIGQSGILTTSKVLASLYADSDDVYAQDWYPPMVRNIIEGVGFDIVLRANLGTFKGSAKLNWNWS